LLTKLLYACFLTTFWRSDQSIAGSAGGGWKSSGKRNERMRFINANSLYWQRPAGLAKAGGSPNWPQR